MATDQPSFSFAARRRWAFGLAAFTLIADQVTKLWVLRTVPKGEMRPVTSWFAITHSRNEGAAFGSLDQHPEVLTSVALAATLLVGYVLARATLDRRYMAIGLALVLGGALGNLIDRLYLGAVVDFLKLHKGSLAWPDFNIADIGVTVGAVLVAAYLYGGAQSSALRKLREAVDDEEALDEAVPETPALSDPEG